MSELNVDINLKLGRRIRSFRQSKGWSQEKLAEKAGLHRTYIGSIERGEVNVSLNNIVLVASALEVKIVELFIDDEN